MFFIQFLDDGKYYLMLYQCIADNADIVVSTLTASFQFIKNYSFDVTIIDEASQV